MSSTGTSYDSDEPPPLELNIEELLIRATAALGTRCTSAERLTKGANHEIYVLTFEEWQQGGGGMPHSGLTREAGNCCIARFTREKSDTAVRRDASEAATLAYLRDKTDIPVPGFYHQDLRLDNEVGAPYVLMERIPGRHLYEIWPELPLNHKKAALSQVASVVVQLASLRFEAIGSLQEEEEEEEEEEEQRGYGLGPVITKTAGGFMGPFSSTDEYLQSFVSTEGVSSPELIRLFVRIQEELRVFLSRHGHKGYLCSPFAMIHADLDGQNLLFTTHSSSSSSSSSSPPPRLSGVIDFEYAYAGPLYFLYEHPIFIQDVSWSKELYAENAILRPHFVKEIWRQLPDSASRETFISCMNSKTYALSGFHMCFMSMECSEGTLLGLARSYLEGLESGNPAYEGRMDYRPEFYLPDGTLVPAGGGHSATDATSPKT
ncbi:hypothetical protein ACRE_079570 [Hapsidospora chrysogenum ATCC 11550]|uniref:Aminoglycoside phosphotransferase domain-containing protein n=1 Tax=Hapsidospora chrysogenum (strain ATCC 11550 / CBS 779.69 / DSM 880 / IAM 14645 / JCM 23072 / IMI 49137) TaxID=857340 RepID=A0A086SW41_HAPC1|nr:hypothetical protein ACRE_079570 [Hapsidospora chrysogenum ATCC 11550]